MVLATSSAPSTKQPPAAPGTSWKTPPRTAWRSERVFIGGGGARSPLWLQIHADILKKPIHLTRESESCALGSAMAAAIAAGIYPDFDDRRAGPWSPSSDSSRPNPAHSAVYDDLFQRVRPHLRGVEHLSGAAANRGRPGTPDPIGQP